MNAARRISTRLTLLVAIGAAAAIGMQGDQASAGQSGAISTGGPGAGLKSVPFGHHNGSGFTHAYADTGDGAVCAGATADAIDVYGTGGGTPVQAFTTDANQCHAYFGTDTLAYVPVKKGPGCLLLADLNNEVAPGYWDSFSLKSDGTIVKEVSHVVDTYKVGKTQFQGTPDDVVAAGTGAVGTDALTGNLIQLTVNAKTCALGKLKAAAGPSGATYLNAIVYGKDILGADYTNNSVDAFTIKPLRFVKATTSSVTAGTDGISTNGKAVATGSTQTSASQVQGTPSFPGTWTVSGDSSWTNTASTGQDTNCLWGINENVVNKTATTIGYYKNPGAPSFQGDVPVLNGSYVADNAQDVGGTFYVNDFLGGEIDSSPIGSNCSLTLSKWAQMSDPNGHSSGLIFV
ncbi:MAG TPA: hypothetical protein VKX16_04925 [Chloroflexota bacterium]|nr:hypothetical protein [Chloroflexota bacterium]